MAEFGLSSAAMKKINARIRQKEATTGRRISSSELTALYEAELNVASGRALERGRLSEQKRQFDVSAGFEKERLALTKEQIASGKRASTVKGATDIAGLALAAGGKKTVGDIAANVAFGKAPFAPVTTTTTGGGAAVVPSVTSTAGIATESGLGVTTGTALQEVGGFTVSGAQTAVTGTELATGAQIGVAEVVGETAVAATAAETTTAVAAGETAASAAPALSPVGVAIAGAVGGFLGAELGEQEWFQDITPWGGETTERTIGGIAGGAAAGFAIGGPVGALAGALIGGFIGLFG